jgi:hypothetical protein
LNSVIFCESWPPAAAPLEISGMGYYKDKSLWNDIPEISSGAAAGGQLSQKITEFKAEALFA